MGKKKKTVIVDNEPLLKPSPTKINSKKHDNRVPPHLQKKMDKEIRLTEQNYKEIEKKSIHMDEEASDVVIYDVNKEKKEKKKQPHHEAKRSKPGQEDISPEGTRSHTYKPNEHNIETEVTRAHKSQNKYSGRSEAKDADLKKNEKFTPQKYNAHTGKEPNRYNGKDKKGGKFAA